MPRKVKSSPRGVKDVLGSGREEAQKRYRLFAYAFIANGRNGTRAAIEVGYSPKTAAESACRLLKMPDVRAIIDASTEKALSASELTVERTLKEVARLAYSDVRSLYRADGSLKNPDEWDDDTAAAVASIETSEEFQGRGEDRELAGYTKKVRMFDKVAALDKAMKHLGLYERDNKQRIPIQVTVELLG